MILRIPKPILRLYHEITIIPQILFQEFITLKDRLSLRFRGVISESVEFLLAVRLYVPQVLKLAVGLEFLESITNMLELRLRNALLLLEQIHVRLRSAISETVSLETLSRIAYGVRGLVNLVATDRVSYSLSALLWEISKCLDNVFGALRRSISETLTMSTRLLYQWSVTRVVLLGLSEFIVRRFSISFLEISRLLEQLTGSLRRSISETVSLNVLLRNYFTIVRLCLLALSETITRRILSGMLESLRTLEQIFGGLRRSITESLTLGPRCFIQYLQRMLASLVLTEVILRRLDSPQFERCRALDQSSWGLRRAITETLSQLVRCSFWIRTMVRPNLVVSERIVYSQPQPPIFDVAIFDQDVFW